MRKRSKYRPRPVYNPLHYVLEGFRPVRQHQAYTNLIVRNHLAGQALMRGEATRNDMDDLIQMNNVVRALVDLGFGAEYRQVADDGMASLLCITRRGKDLGRFVATGPELNALRSLMELHDAQMDVITVADLERAIESVRKTITAKKAVVI